ncbi:MAG TPA: hypothetical protein VHB46_18060 [Burkholderiales bacterium]|nr:hypothetical protein [Burkholderiales bacterium]
MTPEISDDSAHARHPAPQRGRANRLTLAFALFTAPVAWLLQLGASFFVAAHACHAESPPLQNIPSGLRWLLAGFNLGATVLAIVAVAVAVRLWGRTRQEHTGSAHTLVDVGEGRTRFLALCAMIAGIAFLVALLFTGVGLFGVPLCGE